MDEFDAGFGLSSRGAAAMDPQQRLALELAWEALEDAGVAASALDGDPVGVFLGAIAGDIIANRVSRTLGLSGPSLTVDAGQAASLVAVHLAAESLRRGRARLHLPEAFT